MLVVLVSASWQIHGWPHDVVKEFCAYRGEDLFTVKAYRVMGGALLIPNADFYLGLPGLLLALYPLERRIGSWRLLGMIVFAHIVASLSAGFYGRLAHDTHTLHQLDVGTSVLMASAAAALATYARSRGVWAVVTVLFGLDLVLSHDLASAEHAISLVLGVVYVSSRLFTKS
jgi:hypothetical protein